MDMPLSDTLDKDNSVTVSNEGDSNSEAPAGDSRPLAIEARGLVKERIKEMADGQ